MAALTENGQGWNQWPYTHVNVKVVAWAVRDRALLRWNDNSVDVYVNDPSAATISAAASFPQRNYQVAAGPAWSRLLEVQGFGQRYLDASGGTVGTIAISANAISRHITFSVPIASMGGTPTSGWGFTVVLTGQDGFSPDQARGFQSVPQWY